MKQYSNTLHPKPVQPSQYDFKSKLVSTMKQNFDPKTITCVREAPGMPRDDPSVIAELLEEKCFGYFVALDAGGKPSTMSSSGRLA